MNKNYYAVKCKCGHVGRHNYVLVTYGIVAENGKEAARIARWIPRCKHHHKDCIREVTQISYEEYLHLVLVNNSDPYLKCSSTHDQKNIDMSGRLFQEAKDDTIHDETIINKVYKGKIAIRKPKKYMRFYCESNSYENMQRY